MNTTDRIDRLGLAMRCPLGLDPTRLVTRPADDSDPQRRPEVRR